MVDDPLVSTEYRLLDIFFSGWVANLAKAILILLIGFVIGKFVEKLLQRLFGELQLNKAGRRFKVRLEELLSKLASYTIYLVTIILCLQALGIAGIVGLIVIVLVLGFMAVSILLGMSDFVPNALARLFSQKKYVVGQFVSVGNLRGRVIKRRLAELWLDTDDGMVVVPNSQLR
ncbi:MAG: hypothetical protein ABIF10_04855 [Candidatus Woesearchaeota archaeon]